MVITATCPVLSSRYCITTCQMPPSRILLNTFRPKLYLTTPSGHRQPFSKYQQLLRQTYLLLLTTQELQTAGILQIAGILQVAGTPRTAGNRQLSFLQYSASQRGIHFLSQWEPQLLTSIGQSSHMVRRVSTGNYQKLGKHRVTRE